MAMEDIAREGPDRILHPAPAFFTAEGFDVIKFLSAAVRDEQHGRRKRGKAMRCRGLFFTISWSRL